MIIRERRIMMSQGTIGLISDTHGIVRPQALAALQGVDLIVHAGDIGKPEVLASLAKIAPVFAIRGNNDHGPWAESLPDILRLRCGAVSLRVIHNVNEIDWSTTRRDKAVISGHSHKPVVSEREGVLCINPGSAGPRRFKLPIAVGKLKINGVKIAARIIELAV
jgi:putative phosphoesterase